MLTGFFSQLRAAGVKTSLRELLDLLAALDSGVVFADMEDFYWLSRTCLVKDEKYYDRFDRAFGAYFKGLESLDDLMDKAIPNDWLRAEFERVLSEAEKRQIEAMGGLEALMKAFQERLEEQKKRHQGGNRMIGTGGTSPFGANGYNPEGFRIGQAEGRHKRAIKVWDQRSYRDLDDSITLGIRNIKVALRRLRKFARQGAAEELDLPDTIRSTANNAGYLDLRMVPERHNAVKVLLFLDVGGSMDPHIRVCEELFSAARTEFKHLEHFYFHNFVYETVWKNNLRRSSEGTSVFDILHRYGNDYRIVFVGDASMAPYEITHAGGSIEHWNEEPGAVWMRRLTEKFDRLIWLNPIPEEYWGQGGSLALTRELVEDRMYPLSLDGLERGMKYLGK